jgi:DNA-binding transcriptional regulator YiaG
MIFRKRTTRGGKPFCKPPGLPFRKLSYGCGEASGWRSTAYPHTNIFMTEAPDIKAISAKRGVSQEEFALLLGISVITLENWEQKRRISKGPARVLLEVAGAHPDAVWDVVRRAKRSR